MFIRIGTNKSVYFLLIIIEGGKHMKAEQLKLTLLHSNDMHGDFLAEDVSGNGHLIGGLGLLSGYISQVRKTEDNVIYAIAGDMVQGSLIDAEYRGASTIELMNFLSPDVVTLGNHELDYGLPHLLFLEKVANFPIVNANLYMKKYGKRLMDPYIIMEVAGFKIMFIGVITETTMDSIALDQLIGTFISIEDAAAEIGKICNAYRNDDIDLTIALTHIGFESDLELASLLDPNWGVDIIIGGHTHTVLKEPAIVNDILIVQAGEGTDQIGRFDLVIDEKTNSISNWTWDLVPINNETSKRDEELQTFLDGFKNEIDEKYNKIITRFSVKLTHPIREVETTLGNMVTDALAGSVDSDVILIGSGAIRSKELGPVVTLGTLKACFPYDDSLSQFTITGKQLKAIFTHIMRVENRDGEGEFYQVNDKIKATYSESKKQLISLKFLDEDVEDMREYTITLQGYHVVNCAENIGITFEQLSKTAPAKVVSTSAYQVLEEWLRAHPNIRETIDGRLVFEQ